MGSEISIPLETETQKTVIDMAPILERVPPIEGVFSPGKEVEKLRSVPKAEKKETVAIFKDKLARQREAWALCRTSIEERIESNPDLPKEEMVSIIDEFASNYGFPKDHTKIAESLIDDYMEMHVRVIEIRKKYPDDITLVNKITKMKFSKSDAEDFEVSAGPMSIEILCSGFNAGRIFERSDDPVLGFQYGGFSSQSLDKKPIYYLVVNMDFATLNPSYHAAIVPHEREHLKNRILQPRLYDRSEVRPDVREKLNQDGTGLLRHQISERLLGFERNFLSEVFQKYKKTKDPEEKAFLLTEYMRLHREFALNRAKNEIMAINSEPHLWLTYNIFGLEDTNYDYLANIKDYETKKDDTLWKETAQRVLVDEYSQIIDSAVIAFDRLRDGGYLREEVIALLSDKRLSEWPKTTRRLLIEKRKRNIG